MNTSKVFQSKIHIPKDISASYGIVDGDTLIWREINVGNMRILTIERQDQFQVRYSDKMIGGKR